MKQGIKDKTTKLMVKLGKMTAVANPAHGPEFLEEVCSLLLFSLASFDAFIFTSKCTKFCYVGRLKGIGV